MSFPVALLENELQLAKAMRYRGVAIEFIPDALACMRQYTRLFIPDLRAMQQGCHRGLGQASAPFGLTRDDPDDLAVVVERNCDEIGAVATIDFPDSLRVVTERPEIFLDVIMFAEQEDRHLPEVAPNKFILVGFGDEPSHSLTEERSEEHTSELQSLMRISYAVFCL